MMLTEMMMTEMMMRIKCYEGEVTVPIITGLAFTSDNENSHHHHSKASLHFSEKRRN